MDFQPTNMDSNSDQNYSINVKNFEEPTKPPSYVCETKCSTYLLCLATASFLIGIIMTATNPPSSTGNSAANISGPILLGFGLFNLIISIIIACKVNKKVKKYNLRYFQQTFPSAPLLSFNQSSFQPQNPIRKN